MTKVLNFLDFCWKGYMDFIDEITTSPTKDELNGIEVVDFKTFIKR